ncbi:hypothetical protein KsCSTR_31970 [Candidatus Kuenenia stuttgartiensis]|uniref:Uncharacterized protein n=1 Tax=Kuenenia stuttgartiensis TaxID=174633 RepID=Q1Q4T9_KUEST|nr:hypothetical protein KsCSTR_31970 [Candidatus Kuenenia stuttgartiensis]CAJ75031.1 unknown protein [Candidatus Kuenenia stuttgartiensis]
MKIDHSSPTFNLNKSRARQSGDKEIRSTKSETNFKMQNPNEKKTGFEHLNI